MTQRLARTIPSPVESAEEEPDLEASLRALQGLSDSARFLTSWGERSAWRASQCEAQSLSDAVGSRTEETPYGPVLVVDTYFPLSSNHGARCVGALFQQGREALDTLHEAAGDARLEGFCPKQTLFIDIESSGLRHGAGTYAFIVGIGFYELSSCSFVVRQLIAEEPSSEQAMLHVLVEHIDRFPFLSSFNGKSYDLTVIISRLIAQRFYTRRECNLKLRPHLDLLHLCKSIYRGCWGDSKLQTMERHALGFERVGDVPGSLVPSCWYHYLRTGDPRPVAEVARHNLYDIVSMVTLADRVLADLAPSVHEECRNHQVQANVGRLWLRRGRPDLAWSFLRVSLTQALPSEAWGEQAYRDAAVAVRRAGSKAERHALLRSWCEAYPRSEAAWTAASIFYERVIKDLPEAFGAAWKAHALARSPEAGRRVARLQQRVNRRRRMQVDAIKTTSG